MLLLMDITKLFPEKYELLPTARMIELSPLVRNVRSPMTSQSKVVPLYEPKTGTRPWCPRFCMTEYSSYPY
ncbi:hypothetical protein [Chitinivibrio alkaliphilus]|uniref:Uncharacterized protein n=1 Tax=Chitinivibrio alkaliphilus ACht1 TaxID=1313304 RepID=U7D8C2_9BACT|nr:hypothetical protein [Chitinivibrio alkaliphilus]ERP30670.1 hypothetical protein CALK_2529 [Chitinivibrio alkaliphilus ACht1]